MKKYILPILCILCIAVTVMVLGLNKAGEKTAYVSIAKVYDSFLLTKQLNAKYETVTNQRKSILDSLEVHLHQLESGIRNSNGDKEMIGKYNKIREDYFYKKEAFESSNRSLSDSYNEQIMNQLNQYIADYGKEHGYVYIFGANGSGSIMFAEESRDISDVLTIYVNERYEGKKK